MSIKHCVILCAGYATRFLPATKCIPKEMLPLFNTPIVARLVDDAISNGVTKITFVLRKGKEMIFNHFVPSKTWEKQVNKELLALFEKYKNVQFNCVFQQKPLGTGDALMCAKKYCKQPFCLLNGDEIIMGKNSYIKQLLRAYEKNKASIIATKKIKENEANKYGMIKFDLDGKVDCVIEKPQGCPPSLFCNLGGYVFTPKIFDYITLSKTKQVPITDAINAFVKDKNAFAPVKITGRRYDIGNPLSYALSNIDFCYHNSQTHAQTKAYLHALLKSKL